MEYLKSWTNNLVNTLETELDKSVSEKIIENCGRICAKECGATKEVEEIIKSLGNTASVDSIIEKMNNAGIAGGKLRKDGNVIVGIYEQCYCPSRKHIKSNLYCKCTQGWVKEVFEMVFDKKVDVVLEKSIAWGDEICKFIVTY
jgi:predicted hydrocarbon binding protein